jgi:hydroxymethylglutaryl-CoA synthase
VDSDALLILSTMSQGVDCVGACLGATTAFFNAVNWMESRAWDGRLAIVVRPPCNTFRHAENLSSDRGKHSPCTNGARASASLDSPPGPYSDDR